ncbi:hypothetical protein [Petrachloros mirabilis]
MSATNAIPTEFVRQAEPGVTLTALTTHPDRYKDKVVILGGVPLSEVREGDRFWLWMRNRPLDQNYVPHLPSSRGGPEDGHYWVLVLPRDIPLPSHKWARVTVVGRVLPPLLSAPEQVRAKPDPVLAAVYVSSQPFDESHPETWASQHDLQYIDMRGGDEPSQDHCWTCRSLYGGE